MYEFSMQCPVVFGIHSLDNLAEKITRLYPRRGVKRFLVVTSTIMEWNRTTISSLMENLSKEGISALVFDEIPPNPTTFNIEKGKKVYTAEGCNGIIALGGGSPIDASKIIAEKTDSSLLITIPTTSGTGSEISPWSVITITETNTKMSICSRIPDLAVVDPKLTITMTPAQTLVTGMDAFSHAVEAFISKKSNSFTNGLAFESIRLIRKSLLEAVKNGNDLNARKDMMEASLLAGVAMMHAGLGLAHVMANTIGGFYHESVHGWLITQTLEKVLEFNKNTAQEKYGRIELIVKGLFTDVDQRKEIIGLTRDVFNKEHFKSIVDKSMNNINGATNPRKFTNRDLESLFLSCFDWK